MAFQFDSDPVPIPRAEELSAETFNLRYRNKHPVILSKIISDWVPVTNWTASYLQKALEHEYDHDLQVFVSHDNRQFINHPEVTQTITTTPEEFLSNVFSDKEAHDSVQADRQRYYLRTFSMPEILFRDVNVPKQIKSLLDVVCYVNEGNVRNNKLGTPEISDKENGHCKEDDRGSASSEEMLSPWEEMLSPPYSHAVSQVIENEVCSHVSKKLVPVHESCSSSSIINIQNKFTQCSSVNYVKHSDAMDIIQKCGHCHSNKSVSLQCREMYNCIFNQSTMQLWIGTQGNVTPLHYDRNHGLLAQIIGRKELILFSHEDTLNVYPHVSYSERAHTSRVDLHKPDAEGYTRFPKLRNAQPYRCILEPGELLYMPPFWWHDVTSLDNCISVTLPWDISSNEAVPSCMLT